MSSNYNWIHLIAFNKIALSIVWLSIVSSDSNLSVGRYLCRNNSEQAYMYACLASMMKMQVSNFFWMHYSVFFRESYWFDTDELPLEWFRKVNAQCESKYGLILTIIVQKLHSLRRSTWGKILIVLITWTSLDEISNFNL